MWEFEIWQDGQPVAGGTAFDGETARREASHYAFQYGQDGPVAGKVWEVGRKHFALTFGDESMVKISRRGKAAAREEASK